MGNASVNGVTNRPRFHLLLFFSKDFVEMDFVVAFESSRLDSAGGTSLVLVVVVARVVSIKTF